MSKKSIFQIEQEARNAPPPPQEKQGFGGGKGNACNPSVFGDLSTLGVGGVPFPGQTLPAEEPYAAGFAGRRRKKRNRGYRGGRGGGFYGGQNPNWDQAHGDWWQGYYDYENDDYDGFEDYNYYQSHTHAAPFQPSTSVAGGKPGVGWAKGGLPPSAALKGVAVASLPFPPAPLAAPPRSETSNHGDVSTSTTISFSKSAGIGNGLAGKAASFCGTGKEGENKLCDKTTTTCGAVINEEGKTGDLAGPEVLKASLRQHHAGGTAAKDDQYSEVGSDSEFWKDGGEKKEKPNNKAPGEPSNAADEAAANTGDRRADQKSSGEEQGAGSAAETTAGATGRRFIFGRQNVPASSAAQSAAVQLRAQAVPKAKAGRNGALGEAAKDEPNQAPKLPAVAPGIGRSGLGLAHHAYLSKYSNMDEKPDPGPASGLQPPASTMQGGGQRHVRGKLQTERDDKLEELQRREQKRIELLDERSHGAKVSQQMRKKVGGRNYSRGDILEEKDVHRSRDEISAAGRGAAAAAALKGNKLKEAEKAERRRSRSSEVRRPGAPVPPRNSNCNRVKEAEKPRRQSEVRRPVPPPVAAASSTSGNQRKTQANEEDQVVIAFKRVTDPDGTVRDLPIYGPKSTTAPTASGVDVLKKEEKQGDTTGRGVSKSSRGKTRRGTSKSRGRRLCASRRRNATSAARSNSNRRQPLRDRAGSKGVPTKDLLTNLKRHEYSSHGAGPSAAAAGRDDHKATGRRARSNIRDSHWKRSRSRRSRSAVRRSQSREAGKRDPAPARAAGKNRGKSVWRKEDASPPRKKSRSRIRRPPSVRKKEDAKASTLDRGKSARRKNRSARRSRSVSSRSVHQSKPELRQQGLSRRPECKAEAPSWWLGLMEGSGLLLQGVDEALAEGVMEFSADAEAWLARAVEANLCPDRLNLMEQGGLSDFGKMLIDLLEVPDFFTSSAAREKNYASFFATVLLDRTVPAVVAAIGHLFVRASNKELFYSKLEETLTDRRPIGRDTTMSEFVTNLAITDNYATMALPKYREGETMAADLINYIISGAAWYFSVLTDSFLFLHHDHEKIKICLGLRLNERKTKSAGTQRHQHSCMKYQNTKHREQQKRTERLGLGHGEKVTCFHPNPGGLGWGWTLGVVADPTRVTFCDGSMTKLLLSNGGDGPGACQFVRKHAALICKQGKAS
ncbi:unnamed protein product [Amoebophrya sp. A120]|nr:unnamed protein product [Amoebophrya sp. A120]|eukprot:GSA120T00021258001.1